MAAPVVLPDILLSRSGSCSCGGGSAGELRAGSGRCDGCGEGRGSGDGGSDGGSDPISHHVEPSKILNLAPSFTVFLLPTRGVRDV